MGLVILTTQCPVCSFRTTPIHAVKALLIHMIINFPTFPMEAIPRIITNQPLFVMAVRLRQPRVIVLLASSLGIIPDPKEVTN